jgi:cystathionine beta-lyase/cystathionine gamma-synthase
MGDHVASGQNIYGGSHRLMEQVYSELGLTFSFVDMRDLGNVERALTPKTRMIFCETPTNPMMHLTDLSALGDLAQARGYLFVVDNTFASPYFQRPLTDGADIVLHSTRRPISSVRSLTVPILSSIARPSISTATATWWADSWSRPEMM